MQLAERMAQRAIGSTYPNPSVGAIIVKDKTIIARGEQLMHALMSHQKLKTTTLVLPVEISLPSIYPAKLKFSFSSYDKTTFAIGVLNGLSAAIHALCTCK